MKRFYRAPWWPLWATIAGRSDAPILVGPFRGEVGFEALYWLPFLAQVRHTYGIDPARCVPITRGGFGALYGSPQGVELFALRTPQEVRIENRLQSQLTGQMKQTHRTRWDRAVLADAAATLGLRRYHVLDPAWMYQRLAPFWQAERGLAWLQRQVRFEALPVPALPEGLTVAPNTVAMRFYFRSTFPHSPQTLDFTRETITQVAAQQPVILLTSGLHVDDHADAVCRGIPNVRILHEETALTPENNLAVQAAVLARCVGLVGTYGGLAQLALRYGKPTLSVYTDWSGTALAHRQLSDALALQLGVPFLCLRLGDMPLMQSILPKFSLHMRTGSSRRTVD